MPASLQKVAHSSTSSGDTCTGAAAAASSIEFPVGLKVLVIDDDAITLKIIERMSIRYHYRVTTCSEATVALNLLRERKGCFDVVLSDIHMPDMDGYILREEELRNIWQHVVRKIWNGNKEHENSGSMEDNDRNKRGNDDNEHTSSIVDATERIVKAPKKRSTLKEEDVESENDDPSTSKKPRVVWSVELHQQFVSAVNQLGVDIGTPSTSFRVASDAGSGLLWVPCNCIQGDPLMLHVAWHSAGIFDVSKVHATHNACTWTVNIVTCR